jgi:hypothetical protein
MLKICSRCSEEKSSACFGKNSSRWDGLAHYCSDCHRASVGESRRRRANKEPIRKRSEYQHRIVRGIERGTKNRAALIKNITKYAPGMTIAVYEYLLISQSGRCACCLTPLKCPFIDHDHSTGRIRGLLCMQCNIALGLAHDNPIILRSLASYLEAIPYNP